MLSGRRAVCACLKEMRRGYWRAERFARELRRKDTDRLQQWRLNLICGHLFCAALKTGFNSICGVAAKSDQRSSSMQYQDLNIIHEDNHILVAVKPQNVPSQEDESKDPDMLTLLKSYIKESKNKPGNVYLGLVHRLDRPTGGVMVFAKTSKAAARLSQSMKNGEFEKSYLAVTVGCPKEKKAELITYLKKNPVNNRVYVCAESADGGKKASLNYKVISERQKIALLKVDLQTGRSHQIRVQLAHIGCPIFGDAKYGGDTLAKGHFLNLWAYCLKFPHPVSGETMSYFVLPPEEEEAWKRFDYHELVDIR